MTTLKQSVRVAYKSSAVAYAAAKTKERISRLEKEESEKRMNEREPTKRGRINARLALWHNYYSAQGYAMDFFSEDEASIRVRLENLWVQMGNTLADLPDWDRFANADLKTVVTFRNLSGLSISTIRTVERNFTGNSSEIPNTTFEAKFEEMFDLFVNDIWAAEGMRRWTQEELVRGPESASDLATWDSINNDAGKFFKDAKRCCVRMANNFRQYERGRPNETEFKSRYTHRSGNRYNAVQGLWALDAGDLTPEYLLKVENKRVTYR